ncbi:hypothetical protein ACWEKJ_40005 [Amycolatopsis thermoflava]
MVDDAERAELARRFAADMQRGVAELARLGYDAKLFRSMLAEHGPVEAARRLVLARDPSYGLWRLKTLRQLHMSVEMWVLLPRYAPLFDDTVREQAEIKLRQLDVDVEGELDRLVRRQDP